MKPELTQAEMRKLLTRPYRGMGVTKRGRFIAMEPGEAFKYVGA